MKLVELLNRIETGTIISLEESKSKFWANEEQKTIIKKDCLVDMYYKVADYFNYDVIGITVIENNILYIVIYNDKK